MPTIFPDKVWSYDQIYLIDGTEYQYTAFENSSVVPNSSVGLTKRVTFKTVLVIGLIVADNKIDGKNPKYCFTTFKIKKHTNKMLHKVKFRFGDKTAEQ